MLRSLASSRRREVSTTCATIARRRADRSQTPSFATASRSSSGAFSLPPERVADVRFYRSAALAVIATPAAGDAERGRSLIAGEDTAGDRDRCAVTLCDGGNVHREIGIARRRRGRVVVATNLWSCVTRHSLAMRVQYACCVIAFDLVEPLVAQCAFDGGHDV